MGGVTNDVNRKVTRFVAVVHKVQNVSHGGHRVTFNVPSTNGVAAAELLMVADTPGILVEVEVRWQQR